MGDRAAMGKPVKHVSRYMNAFLNKLPEEQKKKVLVDRKIKQVHQQFSACVDPFILDHVNSVYLIKEPSEGKGSHDDVSRETRLILTVYVDNSLIAAELNAQRELVVLKYRELFSLQIDDFRIKISRGAYLENHPFEKKDEEKPKKIRRLTPEEEAAIDSQVDRLSDPEIRASFQRALKATKEHPLSD